MGFAMLPASTLERQAFMQDYMKNLILTSVTKIINKYIPAEGSAQSNLDEFNSSSFGLVAVKVAIEFCLTINEVEFLFGQILEFFTSKGLE